MESFSRNRQPSAQDIINFYKAVDGRTKPDSFSEYYSQALEYYQKQEISFVELCEYADFYKPLNGHSF